jgi:RNA polymerase sigma-70 factor, ECF subfamily
MVATSGSAVQQLAQSAEDKLAVLDRLFRQPLLGYVGRTMLGDQAAAEDIVQETFTRAWRYLGQHDDVDPATLRPWLYTVARRLVIDVLRARRARPTEVMMEDLARLAVAEDGIAGLVRAESLRAALLELSAHHRHVLIELYFHDRSPAEIAQRLGVPIGTVRSRSYYAKRALRKHLEG